MPINTSEIIDFLSKLAEEERLQLTVKETAKAAAIAGGSALIGGLLLGPAGIAVGGCIGACTAAATAKNFESVPKIIMSMEPEQKEHLAENIRHIMKDVGVQDIACFAAMMGGNSTLKEKVVGELADYLKTEMRMAISGR